MLAGELSVDVDAFREESLEEEIFSNRFRNVLKDEEQ